MRTLRLLLPLVIMLLMARSATAATVTGNVFTASSVALTNSRISFTPQSTPVIDGGTQYVSKAVSLECTNGTFSTTLVVGRYLMRVDDATRDTLTIYVPNNTNTYGFNELVTNAVNFASSNAFPFILRSSGTGTNTTLVRPLLSLTNGPPTNGWTVIADGTTGLLKWAAASSSSGGITSDDTGNSITSDD